MDIDFSNGHIVDITIHFQHQWRGEYPHNISAKFQITETHMIIEKHFENIVDIDEREG
jgi:hypothetical protein